MLDIGKFDSKVLFEVASITHDAMGGAVYEWQEGFFAWAHIDFKNGKSSDNENRLESSMSVEFTIRDNTTSSEKVTAQEWRIAYPTEAGAVVSSKTQYYTVTGIYMWGGRNKYKTMITELNANAYPISEQ